MTIPAFPQQLLGRAAQWVSGSQPSTGFYYLIKALFDRTGGDNGTLTSSGSALVAAGSNQANALALMDDFNAVTMGVGGVKLAALQPGLFQVVFNGLTGNLAVYPAQNGAIDVLGINSPYTLAPNKSQLFWCEKLLSGGGQQYHSLQLG